jgi:hypothetical protein
MNVDTTDEDKEEESILMATMMQKVIKNLTM